MRRFLPFLFLFLSFCALLPSAVAAPCDALSLSLPVLPDTINYDATVNGTLAMVAPNGTLLGATPLTTLEAFSFENGAFSFVPGNASSNQARILFYAVTPDGCTETALLSMEVRFPPRIDVSPASEEPHTVSEGSVLLFSAASEAPLTWFVDDGLAVRGDEFLYRPTFNDAGMHRIMVLARGADGLTSNLTWQVEVVNKNRAPFQVATFVGRLIPLGGVISFNLDDYFIDLDKTPLTYDVQVTLPKAVAGLGAGISVQYEGSTLYLSGDSPGRAFLTFSVTDTGGLRAESDPVEFQVGSMMVRFREGYCGDQICLGDESCDSCAVDCGACGAEQCTPTWVCADWGACEQGFRYRACVVTNDCANVTFRPPEAETCVAPPACDDGVRNGNETGVDCGGNCAPCPTCSDGIQNQGEEQVDCGGLCAPCPSCDDGYLNQDETDVDCGGSCSPCGDGKACERPLDCASKQCRGNLCAAPTCQDALLNQGEEQVDCGGPCAPCATCSDAIQNQREEQVDCGGPCAACPTCSDGVKNQDESHVDCGGSCAACTWRDYVSFLKRILFWPSLAFLFLFSLFVVRLVTTSQMLFLFSHGKFIHFFYEDSMIYALVRFWNRFAHPFRHEKELREMVVSTMNDLRGARSLPEAALRSALIGKLRGLYSSLFNLSSGFAFDELINTVKRSDLPFTSKVIVLRNTKLLALLELTRLYPSASLAADEMLDALKELEKAF